MTQDFITEHQSGDGPTTRAMDVLPDRDSDHVLSIPIVRQRTRRAGSPPNIVKDENVPMLHKLIGGRHRD